MNKIICNIILILAIALHCPIHSQAVDNDRMYEAKIIKIIEEKEIVLNQKNQLYQKMEIEIKDNGKKVIVENGNMLSANISKYFINDQVYLIKQVDPAGKESFYIRDYIRRMPLTVLFGIFILLTVLVAGKKGLMSILSMAFSFLMIFYSIIPNILNGANPIFTVILAAMFIVPVTFYLSHGFSKDTSISIIATLCSVLITGILAVVFIEATKLTGYSSEESGFLQIFSTKVINMKGILLSGIIIGALGVLDDITIAQTSVVKKLHEANKKLRAKELYSKAMDVGKDHISSMVNTLILVYAGAALPLFLLFSLQPHSFLEIINYEIIAEEIVRSLVGSIGLICAVPITTYLASRNYK